MKLKLIRLRDIRDILRTFDSISGLVDLFVPGEAIDRLKAIEQRVARYANENNIDHDNIWLNEELTWEYIGVIFCDKCLKGDVARSAIFNNKQRIATVNKLLSYLRDMEMLTPEVLLSFGECDNVERLYYAFQRINANNVFLSQSEHKFILANHRAAVSIANIFILLYEQDYAHSLMSVFMREYALCQQELEANERVVYGQGPRMDQALGGQYVAGFLTAMERLIHHGVKIDRDDLVFLMQNADVAMSVATCYMLLANLKINEPIACLRSCFNDELKRHFLLHEQSVAVNSTHYTPVIHEAMAKGFVAALWRVSKYPELVTAADIQTMAEHVDDCVSYSCAFEMIARKQVLANKAGFIELVIGSGEKALPLAAIICQINDLQHEDQLREIGLDTLSSVQLGILEKIFEKILPQKLAIVANLAALAKDVLYLKSRQRLLNCLHRINMLDQQGFDMAIAQAPNIYEFVGLNHIIDSGKYSPRLIKSLLSLKAYTGCVVAALRKMTVCKQPQLDTLAGYVFACPRLAVEVSKTIVDYYREPQSMPLEEVLRQLEQDIPPPDLDANPIPYVLSRIGSDSEEETSYSPSMFHISLGNTPTPIHLTPEDEYSLDCSI
jgi:hypothetical protein